jgi:hypothetical protein
VSSENTETETWENRYLEAMSALWLALIDATPGTEVDGEALAAGTAFAAEIREGLNAGLLSPSIYQARYQPRQACPECPHSYEYHSAEMGCVYGAGDKICDCTIIRSALPVPVR